MTRVTRALQYVPCLLCGRRPSATGVCDQCHHELRRTNQERASRSREAGSRRMS